LLRQVGEVGEVGQEKEAQDRWCRVDLKGTIRLFRHAEPPPPRAIPRVGIASISSIDSIGAAGALRALFGGMVAAIVVVILYRSDRKGGTSLENNSNLT
jgi:hypothetical protein